MTAGIIGEATGLFAVTNIDDILVLSLFFAQGTGHHGSARRVVAGQYLGFAAILAVAVAAALGATFLPESVIPYLGLLPLALGLRAAAPVIAKALSRWGHILLPLVLIGLGLLILIQGGAFGL